MTIVDLPSIQVYEDSRSLLDANLSMLIYVISPKELDDYLKGNESILEYPLSHSNQYKTGILLSMEENYEPDMSIIQEFKTKMGDRFQIYC